MLRRSAISRSGVWTFSREMFSMQIQHCINSGGATRRSCQNNCPVPTCQFGERMTTVKEFLSTIPLPLTRKCPDCGGLMNPVKLYGKPTGRFVCKCGKMLDSGGWK